MKVIGLWYFLRNSCKNSHLEIWRTGLEARTPVLKWAGLELYFAHAFMPQNMCYCHCLSLETAPRDPGTQVTPSLFSPQEQNGTFLVSCCCSGEICFTVKQVLQIYNGRLYNHSKGCLGRTFVTWNILILWWEGQSTACKIIPPVRAQRETMHCRKVEWNVLKC